MWFKRTCLFLLMSLSVAGWSAAPVTASSIQNLAVGENSRAEILINSYVGSAPESFDPGETVVSNIVNAAEGGGCAQVLINSSTAYPCATGGAAGGAGGGSE